jgi:hypothetical protein
MQIILKPVGGIAFFQPESQKSDFAHYQIITE